MLPLPLRLAAAALALHGAGLCWAQAAPASEDAATKPPAPAPAITLLLPLESPDFRAAAEAVRQGFTAAALASAATPTVAVRTTDASPERVVAEYVAAVEGGTRVVVGPMTRSGVAALAASGRVSVPTLALNQAEGGAPVPPGLYLFGLAIEGEARQVARLAARGGPRSAAVVSTATALAHRSRDAFVDEWLVLGGKVTDVLEMQPASDPRLLRQALARNAPELVFLAAEGDAARALRLQIGAALPTFATSQINTAPADRLRSFDLAGVRFTDMPWIVQPEHPALAGLPRPAALEGDAARFYALGLDACRVAIALLEGQRAFEIDGATGRISVAASGTVERRPLAATFRDGRTVPLE
jgi:outer membrane PBP1 activator LpoA protein